MGTVLLSFADGSTRAIRIARNYRLTLFAHACAWARAFPPAPPEGIALDPPPPPKTPSDALILLLGESVAIKGKDVRFLETIAGLARQMVARKKEREKADR